MRLSPAELKSFLDEKVDQYNRKSFIVTDPIGVPHQFDKKEDIEISGFLAATIAWGQRTTIINNANRLMEWMDNSPHEFIMTCSEMDIKPFESFVHRTFNGADCTFFLHSLKNVYRHHGGLEAVFTGQDGMDAIQNFRKVFFELEHEKRTQKHVSDPSKGTSAKRLNMFLRWMVRDDERNVDFGIWKRLKPADLFMPLDIHTGNVARKLGLLERKQNDRKAVEELTGKLRGLDPIDPIKYDFALFGLGAFEKF